MLLTLEVSPETAQALRSISAVTGASIKEVAEIQLASARVVNDYPEWLLREALVVYAITPEDCQVAASRFRRFRDWNRLDCPDFIVDARLAHALGEISDDEAELLISAGRIISDPAPMLGE